MKPSDLSVGETARRAGVPVSTLHFYEAEGLIESWRTPANHRRYDRRELRRIAIIRVAQTLGIPLAEVRVVLERIPRGRTVDPEVWRKAAEPWQAALDARMVQLARLRDQLGYCIGCGCLSLKTCPLYNKDDVLGREGPGARRWMGEEAPSVPGTEDGEELAGDLQDQHPFADRVDGEDAG